MRSRPSRPERDPESIPPPPRVRAPGPALSERSASELYFRELADSHPLTREGEVAIGLRIEQGELAVFEACVRSPLGLAELGAIADELRAGALDVQDLLLDTENEEPGAQPAAARLTAALGRAHALASATGARAPRAEQLVELATELGALRPDPGLADRLERVLRAAAADDARPDAERAAHRASLGVITRGRRAVTQARTDLVQANLRLAVSIARQLQRFDVPLLDLVQEGNLGLMRAAERFDYRRGHRFSTYAAWWIKQAVRRALLGQGKGLRMPAHLAEIRSQVLRARRELLQEQGREPTPEEISERSGLTLEKVRVIGELALDPLSLDAPVGEDGDTKFGDLLAGEEPTADDELARRRLVAHTRELLEGLTPREREVLERRYGLDGDEDETLEEIGRSFSLTRERIRQIEARALEKLLPRSRQRQLGSYLER
jgi:RNA polymerase primary sigma factor